MSVIALYVPPQAAEFGVCVCPKASVTTQRWRLDTEEFTNRRGDKKILYAVMRCDLCGAPHSRRRGA